MHEVTRMRSINSVACTFEVVNYSGRGTIDNTQG